MQVLGVYECARIKLDTESAMPFPDDETRCNEAVRTKLDHPGLFYMLLDVANRHVLASCLYRRYDFRVFCRKCYVARRIRVLSL